MNLRYEKYKIACDRLKCLDKTNFTFSIKYEATKKMHDWVENEKLGLKDCPLKENWHLQPVNTKWRLVKTEKKSVK